MFIMKNCESIIQLLESEKPVFSVEFFPPKDEKGGERMLKTASEISPYNPDFVSITYGAGGGTRSTTLAYARILKEDYGFEVMPHLTCVGHTKDEILKTLDDFAECGFRNIMALRGDPPKGERVYVPVEHGLHYASDLVFLIREKFPHFGIGVGGYPEKHPEAADMETDLKNLKIKIDAGADFITTQLFFDNQSYIDFVEACRAMNILAPVLPGILPVQSLDQVKRFCQMCETGIPHELENKLMDTEMKEQPLIGSGWALDQIKGLIKLNAPGYHIYALNKPQSTLAILKGLATD